MGRALEAVREGLRRVGCKVPDERASFRTTCPAHGGADANLAVSQGREGVLFTCHSHRCSADAIAHAIGLTPADLFDTPRATHAESWRDVAVYRYRDESGAVIIEQVRRELGERLPGKKPEKKFSSRHAESGRMVPGLNGQRRVLYGLPELLAAIAEERCVLVVEGEKAAEAARALGFVATTNINGAEHWTTKDLADAYGYSASLEGAHVVILPDNDDRGRAHARQVGASLAPFAESVRVLELPNLPAAGDIVDWIDAGGTVEQLALLIERAPRFSEWVPSPGVEAGGLPMPKRLVQVEGEVRLEWVVNELLLAGEIGWLGGPDGVMKSALMTHIAGAVATGRKVAGRFDTSEGDVLIVSGEDSEQVLRNRAEAFARGHRWPLDAMLQRISVLALSGLDLRDGDWQRHLSAIVGVTRPVLIVLDPFFELTSGDENSNSESRDVVKYLRHLTTLNGAAVQVVHHFKKASEGVHKRDMFRGANSPVKASRQTYAIDAGPDNTIVVEGVKFSRASLKGTVRERFAIRYVIENDPTNVARWQSARFDFETMQEATFDAAERFVLSSLAGGIRLNTSELKDLAKGTGVSGAGIARALRLLHELRHVIDFEPGPKQSKRWGLVLAGQAGQPENAVAGQADCLLGNHDSDASCLPAPFRGQPGKQDRRSVRQPEEIST